MTRAPRVELFAAGLVIGWLAADLLSGAIHFMADHFGDERTPGVGRTVISTFREHHLDPQRMLDHGFLERNGWNCAGAAVIVLPLISDPLRDSEVVSVLLLSSSLLLAWTNQIHAWAHADHRPTWVSLLQRVGVILPPRVHQRHHDLFERDAPGATQVRGDLRTLFRGHYSISSGFFGRLLSLSSLVLGSARSDRVQDRERLLG